MTKKRSSENEHNDSDNDHGGPIYINQSKLSKQYQKDIIGFDPVKNPTPKQELLTADIVSLDHRSVHALKPGTKQREEVKSLLYNSIVCLLGNEEVGSRSLYAKALAAYYFHLQSANRLKYLLGMVIGVGVSIAFGTGLQYISNYLSPIISNEMLILIVLFSGMGSIASVLTRLSDIDLRQQTSNFMVMISGGTKPLVAIFFSLVVYIILKLKILDIHFGSSEQNGDGIYLVASFLCGFSERFAKDILSRVELSSAPDQTDKKHANS